jgi:hypothetical protein
MRERIMRPSSVTTPFEDRASEIRDRELDVALGKLDANRPYYLSSGERMVTMLYDRVADLELRVDTTSNDASGYTVDEFSTHPGVDLFLGEEPGQPIFRNDRRCSADRGLSWQG